MTTECGDAPLLHEANGAVGLYQLTGTLTATVGANPSMLAGTEEYGPASQGGMLAASFEGTNIISESGSVALHLYRALTVQFLVCPTDLCTGDEILVGFGGDTAETAPYNTLWQVGFAADNLLQYVHEIGSGTDVTVTSGVHLPPGVWSHVAVTRDSAGTGIIFYVNGIQRDTGTASSEPTIGEGGLGMLMIGGHANIALESSSLIYSVLVDDTDRSAALIKADAQRTLTFHSRPT